MAQIANQDNLFIKVNGNDLKNDEQAKKKAFECVQSGTIADVIFVINRQTNIPCYERVVSWFFTERGCRIIIVNTWSGVIETVDI